jgi:hypothetical protein
MIDRVGSGPVASEPSERMADHVTDRSVNSRSTASSRSPSRTAWVTTLVAVRPGATYTVDSGTWSRRVPEPTMPVGAGPGGRRMCGAHEELMRKSLAGSSPESQWLPCILAITGRPRATIRTQTHCVRGARLKWPHPRPTFTYRVGRPTKMIMPGRHRPARAALATRSKPLYTFAMRPAARSSRSAANQLSTSRVPAGISRSPKHAWRSAHAPPGSPVRPVAGSRPGRSRH